MAALTPTGAGRPAFREAIYAAIDGERHRQDEKWGTGDFFDPAVNTAVLTEEMGEIAKAVLERDRFGLEEELVQLAAACVKWLERLHACQTGVRP